MGELTLAASEIEAIELFAFNGGRVIIAADNGAWADDAAPLAARFDVFYGDGFLGGIFAAVVLIPDNPIIDGPAGVAAAFNSASANDGLQSTNPAFQTVAEWKQGPPALGYVAFGDGDVVFLSDFNTFDDDMIDMLDNNVFWRNLFLRPVGCPEDLSGNGAVDFEDILAVLSAWGNKGGPEDLNGNGTVEFGDILAILRAWGPCG